MDKLTILLPESFRYCLPGTVLEGHVEWQLANTPRSITVELHCYTDGSIPGQSEVMEHVVFDAPSTSERRAFQIRIPSQPYSFEGTLFKICWELEARVTPGKHSDVVQLVVSPTGEPVQARKTG